MHRVVISGMGIVSPLGDTAADVSAALRAGRSAIGPITNIATDGLIVRIGAEVRGFDPGRHFADKQLALLDRSAQLALVAARSAAGDSGLAFRALGARAGVIIGSGAAAWCWAKAPPCSCWKRWSTPSGAAPPFSAR